jgi:hypothetical protein
MKASWLNDQRMRWALGELPARHERQLLRVRGALDSEPDAWCVRFVAELARELSGCEAIAAPARPMWQDLARIAREHITAAPGHLGAPGRWGDAHGDNGYFERFDCFCRRL